MGQGSRPQPLRLGDISLPVIRGRIFSPVPLSLDSAVPRFGPRNQPNSIWKEILSQSDLLFPAKTGGNDHHVAAFFLLLV